MVRTILCAALQYHQKSYAALKCTNIYFCLMAKTFIHCRYLIPARALVPGGLAPSDYWCDFWFTKALINFLK